MTCHSSFRGGSLLIQGGSKLRFTSWSSDFQNCGLDGQLLVPFLTPALREAACTKLSHSVTKTFCEQYRNVKLWTYSQTIRFIGMVGMEQIHL